MVDVLTTITINCPVKIVAEYASNPDYATSWYKNIKAVEWKSVKMLSVGSLIAFKAEFLGKKLEYVYEVMEYEPSKSLVMKTANGPFPMETIYTWEEVAEGITCMTLRNRGIPQGFSKLLSPLMSTMIKMANKKDLKLLKRILEQN
ncbi:MAG: SRPBCC family protein [Cytophagales bacterium]|nr:SRPBCC family protein [Cytophagales bacterium]